MPNGIQTKKFKLPSVFGSSKAPNLTPSPTTKFNNLSELASAHLASANVLVDRKTIFSQNIDITRQPKADYSSSASDSVDLTPHEMSLKKIMDLKQLHISAQSIPNDFNQNVHTTFANATNDQSTESCKYVVDLQSALNIHSTSASPRTSVDQTDNNNFFDRGDQNTQKTPLNAGDVASIRPSHKMINVPDILNIQLFNRTLRTTPLGKVLCNRYKFKNQPYINHKIPTKHIIKPFRFDVKHPKTN